MSAPSDLGTLAHLQAFQWKDGEVAPCPCENRPKFKSFKWVPALKLPDWAKGRLYKFSTLASPVTADGQVFDEAQKNRCAGSLAALNAPISIDHENYTLSGQNAVLDADVEGNRLEGLCYVEDAALNRLYDTGKIAGCSLEYFDRGSVPNADGTMGVKGTLCIGLTFVTWDHLNRGFVLGDPNSTVTAMTAKVNELTTTNAVLTAKIAALDLAAADKPTKPKEYADVPDDEFADPVNFKYPIDAAHVVAAWSYINVDNNQAAGGYGDDKWADMKARVKAAMKAHGHETMTLPDTAFAFVGDGERKLQVRTCDGQFDANLLILAVAELAKTPPQFPEAATESIKATIRAGYTELGLAPPEGLDEKARPLIETLNPAVVKRLTHMMNEKVRDKDMYRWWEG